MPTKNHKALFVFLTGLFLCLGFVACEKSVDSVETLKTLNRGNGAEPETLDPQKVRSESAGNIVRDLYEGLLTEASDGSLISGVAETWGYDPQTLCYRFTLRKNSKWSNGETVTASDFERGFNFALNPSNNSPSSELLKPLKTIQAKSPQALELCLEYPVAYFLEILALPVSFPRHAGAERKQHLYNGAYYLEDWTPHDRIVLKKNPYFHAADSVYFEQVNYVSTENANSELKRFLAGELDVTVTVPPADVKRLRESHRSSLKIAPVLNTYFYGFNLSKAPFKDNLKLRKALSLAIDRDILVERILGTGEQAAWSLVPPGIKAYQSPVLKEQAWTQEERIKLAQALYQEAGYSESNPLQFELRYNTSPLHKKTAVALAAMWKTALGAGVSLHNEEWKVFVQSRRQKNTQLFRSGWIADVNDASNYLELLSSTHPLNAYAYANPRYDELLEQAKTETSKRPSLLQAAGAQMLNDHALIPLYYYVSKHMLDPNLQGWEDNSLDHHLSRYLKYSAKN